MSGQIEQPRQKDDKEAQGQQGQSNKFHTLTCNRPVRSLVVEILDLCHWRVVSSGRHSRVYLMISLQKRAPEATKRYPNVCCIKGYIFYIWQQTHIAAKVLLDGDHTGALMPKTPV